MLIKINKNTKLKLLNKYINYNYDYSYYSKNITTYKYKSLVNFLMLLGRDEIEFPDKSLTSWNI